MSFGIPPLRDRGGPGVMEKQLPSEFILDDSSECVQDIADDLEPIMAFGIPSLRAELGQKLRGSWRPRDRWRSSSSANCSWTTAPT
eukprot:7905626-Heterocapsa_arctica.AAC.1